jgi:G:T/U-mismatch repair DNA glycosylase
MYTIHQYLDNHPILPESEKLILGTIHPHDHESFQLPFFYGNIGSLWRILSEAFPGELDVPLSVDGIKRFLKHRKIAISDTIRECQRKNPTALDEDLIPTKLNHQLVDEIRNSKIEEIFFTSGFGKNNAFRLFYRNILGLKITKTIKENRGLILDPNFFGRAVKLTILYSPSGAANVGLSRSAEYLTNAEKYRGFMTPVHQFKVDYYRQKFS